MPWTLPDGEESGVFMSPWASSQRYPICFLSLRKNEETPAATPTAMEWSPPRTSGKKPFAERFFDGSGEIFAGLRDFLKILGVLFADLHLFGLLDFEVADVFDLNAELLDARLEAGAAKGRWAHVHAAAALAEVHWYANDANFLRHTASP